MAKYVKALQLLSRDEVEEAIDIIFTKRNIYRRGNYYDIMWYYSMMRIS